MQKMVVGTGKSDTLKWGVSGRKERRRSARKLGVFWFRVLSAYIER